VTRFRLRDARPEGEAPFYAGRYPGGYRHDVWPDHVERVNASVGMLLRWQTRFCTAADLSCGDGAILRGLPGLGQVWLGDLNPSAPAEWPEGTAWTLEPGALPDSLDGLPESVDLYVLSETIEHMDDPDGLLRAIRGHARYLFLSTPVEEQADSGNTEHYWSWGVSDVHDMLTDAGWSPLEQRVLEPASTRHMPGAYRYQLWLAVAR
jgi:hypothetical protein